LAALNTLATGPPVLGPSPNGPRAPLPVSPAGDAESGTRKPCAGHLDQNVLALRAWYVTLGDSLVNGTAVPPPEHRDAAGRKRLLQCTREAIVSGQPGVARNALLILWANEHLEMLWRLEEHLGRGQDSGPPAADRQAAAPATASAE
jgi:hypothetical protein